MDAQSMHIAMYPWFAMGHFTPFLHLSNKLAQRGHKISFFIPKKAQTKLQHLNHYPHLITFIPITIPHVEGLPHDAETTSDLPFSLFPLLVTAMDRTEKDIQLLLKELKPQIVFFDFSYWLPKLAQSLGIKCVQYFVINPITPAYLGFRETKQNGRDLTEVDLMQPPLDFPDSSIKLYAYEARFVAAFSKVEFGGGLLFHDRFEIGQRLSHATAFKGCREIEGPFVDYLETKYGKPVLLSGPLLPEPPNTTLEEKWVTWLGGFNVGSVVFCAYGSETTLQQNQFEELLLGLELTGLPFLAALKPPNGLDSIEDALPEGFKERVQGRGIVCGGWVPQQLILGHPSVGCFITHCGAGSLTEALVSECQIVLLPRLGSDYALSARLMSRKLKVGLEVEKDEEDGLFTKDSVCRAVKTVMDEGNELGKEVRANHAKLRNFLLSDDLDSFYVDNFCDKLRALL